MASLGFDFGTSNTFIVKRANNGNLTVLNWSSGSNSYYERSLFDDRLGPFSSVGIPTRIGYAGTDSEGNKIWKVGAQTAGIDERNVCTDLKTKINDTIYDFIRNISQNREFEIENMQENIHYGQTFTDAQTGESFYMSAIELSKIFLTEVLKKQDVGLTSILLGQDTNPYSDIMDVDCIVIGVPSNDRAARGDIQVSYDYSSVLADKIFKPVVDSIFGEDNSVRIAVGAEPILAANAYIKKYPNSTNIGDYILVVDIGGGTSDYALIKRTRDSYEVVYHTEGGDRPAGHSFDRALLNTLGATGESFSKIQIRLAKENLFPSFDAYCRTNELDKADPQSRIMYERQYEFSNCAPSSTIRSDNGREYTVFFENNAFSYNRIRLNYYDEFSRVCDGLLLDKVRSYLEEFKETVGRVHLSQIMFVGGTCSMYPLRKIIEATVREEYRDTNNDIKVVFWDNEDCDATDGAILTCSNIIAIGAAYQGAEPNERPATDVPDLYIQVKTGIDAERRAIHKNIKLLSLRYKNTGSDDGIPGFLPVAYPHAFYSTAKERNLAPKKVQFRIMIKNGEREITYPKKPHYYSVDFSRYDNCDGVGFFADVNQNGVVALFAIKNISPTTNRQPAVECYDLNFFDSNIRPKRILQPEHNLRANAITVYPLHNQVSVGRGTILGLRNRRYNFNWRIRG